MFRKIIKILLITVSIIFILIGLIVFKGYLFYRNVFRLSYAQVSEITAGKTSECKKLSECKLIPGDIIVRRYVTRVTELFDETINPYFTHATFYLGNGELFEAVGNNVPIKDQVKISRISETDWLDEDMKNFVIIRPKDYSDKIDEIIVKLKAIANDPEYTFGPLKEGTKAVSCSDIILKYLEDDNIIKISSKNPKIITPDYLFWITTKDSANFNIIGYELGPK